MDFASEREGIVCKVERVEQENRVKGGVGKRQVRVNINFGNARRRLCISPYEVNALWQERDITGFCAAGEIQHAAGKSRALFADSFVHVCATDGFAGKRIFYECDYCHTFKIGRTACRE